MGKSIARGSKKALIDHCYNDPDTRSRMMKKVGRILREEIKTMCSVKTASILRSGNYEDLSNFKWESLMKELKVHAPVLTSVLYSCMKSKSQGGNRMAVIGICASVLFKYRCSRMSLVQKIVTLILHAGHCGKQVSIYTMCQELGYQRIAYLDLAKR